VALPRHFFTQTTICLFFSALPPVASLTAFKAIGRPPLLRGTSFELSAGKSYSFPAHWNIFVPLVGQHLSSCHKKHIKKYRSTNAIHRENGGGPGELLPTS